MSGLAGKTVVLGVTGGIAAYKAAELCRLLIKAGAIVRVVMTEAATRFIAPLTLQTLAGAPVARDLLDADEEARIGHIRLGDGADLILVAPATANVVARIAAGLADDLLTAVILASRAPVLLAPAMNVNMWRNPITQQNLTRLIGLGRFRTVGPDSGELACGWVGEGRLIEPLEIMAAAERVLAPQDLAGRRVVVTAGPTFEPIDDVRYIGNRSSGKMGFAIAESAARRGAAVTLIAGPVALPTPPGNGITRMDVETTAEMQKALSAVVASADVLVMAAAIADFRAATRVAGKLSRRTGEPARVAKLAKLGSHAKPGKLAKLPSLATPDDDVILPGELNLVANPDLLAEISASRQGTRPLLVGFAAEIAADADDLMRRAKQKLADKGCDVIVANDVGVPGLGFGSDDNAVILVFADGRTESLSRAPKIEIADAIWDRLRERLPGQAAPGERRGPRAGAGPRRGAIIRAAALRMSRERRRRA
jgi:phosphopantothenoylcysteine decarboxylase/phosphopantothenate--cysteine ligase